MKQFACGDVVPGCTASFRGDSVEDILGQVAGHARSAHGMASVSPELVEQVTAAIH